jgi:hypothetical protein
LQDRFDYDPETGILTYRNNHSNGKIKAGTPVKVQEGNYAKVVTSDGTKHYAHRIAWALHYDEQLSPNVLVDHINGIKSDNRICNLRLVSYSENGHNRAHQRNNTSGHRGVKWDKKRCRWVAYIFIAGKCIRYGWHKDIEDAIAARLNAEREYNIFVR